MDILTNTSQNINSKIARRSVDISAFFIWSVMISKKQQVSHLLHDVENLRRIENKGVPKLWIINGMVIIILVPFASWVSLTIPFQDEYQCKILVKYHSFGFDLVKDGNNCFVILIIVFFQQFFVYTLRTAVTVVYVIICCSLRNILNTYSELGAKRVTYPEAEIGYVYFKCYLLTQERVLNVLKSFEETMSLPIFLIASSDFMAIIYGVIKLDPLNNLPECNILKYTPGIIFLSLRGLVSLSCVTLAASAVHEASNHSSVVQKNMLKRILLSGEKSNIQELALFSIFQNNPPFVLSAWGVFNFTKGLFLSAFGGVLTYSLLIMQILK
ncbi:uncharacterized protein NPIL_82091 [Nephila pilipes]|uniref:Uncharacterized protein n=1 Tax=Nephila pilipes TaxID=299642 RepID=A0A8X6R033_NEPPI|nr:uncharacterized protein NPIL_82091 [Nephila pilipes]